MMNNDLQNEFVNGKPKEQWTVEHPKCGRSFVLEWKHVKWNPENPSQMWVQCPNCEEVINTTETREILRNGKWKLPEISFS